MTPCAMPSPHSRQVDRPVLANSSLGRDIAIRDVASGPRLVVCPHDRVTSKVSRSKSSAPATWPVAVRRITPVREQVSCWGGVLGREPSNSRGYDIWESPAIIVSIIRRAIPQLAWGIHRRPLVYRRPCLCRFSPARPSRRARSRTSTVGERADELRNPMRYPRFFGFPAASERSFRGLLTPLVRRATMPTWCATIPHFATVPSR